MPHNPYLELYAARIADRAGKYPSRDFSVFYDEDEGERATNVNVVFIPHDAPGPAKDRKNRDQYAAYIQPFACSLDGHSDTAIGIFEYLRDEKGFSSRKEEKRALEEFTKIEGCEWAADRLRGL